MGTGSCGNPIAGENNQVEISAKARHAQRATNCPLIFMRILMTVRIRKGLYHSSLEQSGWTGLRLEALQLIGQHPGDRGKIERPGIAKIDVRMAGPQSRQAFRDFNFGVAATWCEHEGTTVMVVTPVSIIASTASSTVGAQNSLYAIAKCSSGSEVLSWAARASNPA